MAASSHIQELTTDQEKLKTFLEQKVRHYNNSAFISNDPITIPHQFSKQQDIEIAGFFAAIFAWGQRKTIINKCRTLLQLMDNAPHDFLVHHQEKDRERFLNFKHRTFQPTDALYFIEFLSTYYREHESLETAFSQFIEPDDTDIRKALYNFHDLFFSLEEVPERTRKHIATPAKNSTCKRINMFLRWMVREDEIDFGLWKNIRPDQLICPLDVHVNRIARQLGLLHRPQTDWKAACQLTDHLRQLDPHDPVKFDVALFSLDLDQH